MNNFAYPTSGYRLHTMVRADICSCDKYRGSTPASDTAWKGVWQVQRFLDSFQLSEMPELRRDVFIVHQLVKTASFSWCI